MLWPRLWRWSSARPVAAHKSSSAKVKPKSCWLVQVRALRAHFLAIVGTISASDIWLPLSGVGSEEQTLERTQSVQQVPAPIAACSEVPGFRKLRQARAGQLPQGLGSRSIFGRLSSEPASTRANYPQSGPNPPPIRLASPVFGRGHAWSGRSRLKLGCLCLHELAPNWVETLLSSAEPAPKCRSTQPQARSFQRTYDRSHSFANVAEPNHTWWSPTSFGQRQPKSDRTQSKAGRAPP